MRIKYSHWYVRLYVYSTLWELIGRSLYVCWHWQRNRWLRLFRLWHYATLIKQRYMFEIIEVGRDIYYRKSPFGIFELCILNIDMILDNCRGDSFPMFPVFSMHSYLLVNVPIFSNHRSQNCFLKNWARLAHNFIFGSSYVLSLSKSSGIYWHMKGWRWMGHFDINLQLLTVNGLKDSSVSLTSCLHQDTTYCDLQRIN